jgi:hypothetical protein
MTGLVFLHARYSFSYSIRLGCLLLGLKDAEYLLYLVCGTAH